MKAIPLQIVTVGLENGQQGVFIGVPLIREESSSMDSQVEEIWFSSIQEVPDDLTVKQLIGMVCDQLCRCQANIH